MNPLGKLGGSVLVLLLAVSSPVSALAQPDAEMKTAFIKGEPLPESARSAGPVFELASDAQLGPLPDEDPAVFTNRVGIVGAKLTLTPEGIKIDPKRAEKLNASAARLAALLGSGPAPQDAGPDGASGAGPKPAAAGDQTALIARLNAQNRDVKGLVTHEVPENGDVLHAMGDSAVAPAPTMRMRYDALFSDKATVTQDLRTVRSKAGALELPADGHTGLASSQANLDDFVSWVKSVPDGELPNIGYGTLNAGEIGRYERNVLRKSAITLNISIKDAEPAARGAVLFHELYHYWDVEVAKNHYGNVSYGYIDPAHIPEHELDAYYMTAVMWSQTKPDGASSALAQFLNKLPTDRGQVQTMVESSLGQPSYWPSPPHWPPAAPSPLPSPSLTPTRADPSAP
jgi:hypothetical protein